MGIFGVFLVKACHLPQRQICNANSCHRPRITKNVWIVLSSGVLTSKNSVSVSLHTIIPLCSYLKIVQPAEIQTLVPAATVSKREPCLKCKCWLSKPFMLWPRFWQWQLKSWPKYPPAAPVSALAQPHEAEQPWAGYLQASSPLELFPELLSLPLTQAD